MVENNMATQIDRLEQNHEKLRDRVDDNDKLVSELRTDIKWIKWGIFVVVPATLIELIALFAK